MTIRIPVAENTSAEQVLLSDGDIEVSHHLCHLVLYLIAAKSKAMSRRKMLGKGLSRSSPGDDHSANVFQAELVILPVFKGDTVNPHHTQLLAETLRHFHIDFGLEHLIMASPAAYYPRQVVSWRVEWVSRSRVW